MQGQTPRSSVSQLQLSLEDGEAPRAAGVMAGLAMAEAGVQRARLAASKVLEAINRLATLALVTASTHAVPALATVLTQPLVI